MSANLGQVLNVKMIKDKAQDVFINEEALKNIAEEVINYMIRNAINSNFDEVTKNFVRFNPEFHPDCDDHRAADWLFVLNTLNFSLWNSKSAKQWTVDGLNGYHALSIAIKRAIDEDKPIWDPKYYTMLTLNDAEIIFRSDDNETSIPLLNRRLEILHEIGQTLLKEYEDELGIMRLYYVTGTFVAFLKSCKRNPKKMILSLFQRFSTYRDEVNYKGDVVRFFTKAKMLLQDIWIYFNKHEFGLGFQKQNILPTMLMDYRALQVLYHLKALRYSEKLLSRFEKEDEPLESGSVEEIEIRGCVAYILEVVYSNVFAMCERYVKKIPKLKLDNFNSAILIDNFLWDYRQNHDKELKENVPYHNIRSEQY